MNNYQWLLQMDGAERKAWFDAEHVDNQERALDGDTAPESEDSRERLEADIYRAADEMEKFTYGEQFINVNKILRWLDRQAAITAEEAADAWEEYVDATQREITELQAQVDELTAERDNLADDLLTANMQREQYRKLFGMALDWAHEITMLESSIDEGMA